MDPGAPRVVVAGGSLGGLNAALWLRAAGCEVDVFERSRRPLEGQGAGIVLNPATIRWFREHEGSRADEIGVGVGHLRYLALDGGVAAEARAPYRFASYDTLYRRLLAAFGRARYHLGQEVVTGDGDETGVAAALASGGRHSADLLVWADGIGSAGRAQLASEAERHYAGYVAWRGTVAPSEITAGARRALDDAITYCVLPHSHFLTYPIPFGAEPVLNWLWYRNAAAGDALDALMTDRTGVRREVSVPPGSVAADPETALRADAAQVLPPPLLELVRATRAPFLQAVFDIEVRRMAYDRACLIGDAAFAARPHAAAGSAKAAEDAYRLALAVRESPADLPAALRRWERDQLALGRRVLARTREAGERSQFSGTWRVGDPLPFGLHEVGDSMMSAG